MIEVILMIIVLSWNLVLSYRFMDTSGRKWKEFKSTLKKLYFSGELSDEELKEKHADRVTAADWNFLVDYWMSPDSERSAGPAPLVQLPPRSQQCSPTSAAPAALARNDVARSPHAELVGKEVILYAVLRFDLPVAKGTAVSTNPNTIVGGQVLGKQYCEVIVNLVLKRDAILPRPYAEMNNMSDTHMMSIAWPYRKLKVSKASQSIQGTAGSSGRNARRVP